ncbi:DNA polymerase III subunit delta' [Bacillus pinisoli]|uniref:DNA polymerase III subunit delta' n=1 Tax=Bacillus pinisoli TaxID=2901866 RepID=UPI001FF48A2E|nr:DNA polymerase III subunit delta' [Bacillus pinisoli]
MNKTWDDISLQQPIIAKMLTNSIKKNRLAHAYLVEGKKGTGKKEIAKFLAKSLFCKDLKDGIHPCHICINCKRIESGNHPDVHFIEPDGLSIKKQQIQHLQEEFSKTGVESKKKFYIINHADKMTINASNSLLKFLEEPNQETTAVLLTEQVNKMLDTIISRCQILSTKAVQKSVLTEQLIGEGINPLIAKVVVQLTNSIDEAQNLAQDDWFAESRKIVLQLCEVLDSPSSLFYIQDKWLSHFKEREQTEVGLDLLLLYYRDVLSIMIGEEEAVVYRDVIDHLKQRALQVSRKSVVEKMAAILEAKKRLNANVQGQLMMEQLVLNLQEGS